jgi:hypothetical protein
MWHWTAQMDAGDQDKPAVLHNSRVLEVHHRSQTEQKWTKLSGVTFIFIFLCESKNKYRNIGNKYENG